LTVMETVATLESSAPSLALKVKLSAPLKLAFGVYVTLGGVPLSVPLAGPRTMLNVSALPSTSLPVRMIALAVSSSVETD